MSGHNCDTRECSIIQDGEGKYFVHICDGCHNDTPQRRWLVQPHPNWGWWHLDTCSPPDDWPGPHDTDQ
jgi:hypothetical protein